MSGQFDANQDFARILAKIQTKRRSLPQRRWWLPEEKLWDKTHKHNYFLKIFTQLCGLYHYRITRQDDFVLQINDKYKSKLRFLYNFMTKEKSIKGLYLFGGYGTGKTMTLWALAEMLAIFNENFEYKLHTVNQIIDLYREVSETKDFTAFNRYKNVSLLIIDDLGSEPSDMVVHFGNKVKPIENILEYRYKTGQWTWITSNYSLKQLSQKYSGYIIDRLRGIMYFVEFDWDSFRG